ncbi:ribbon-helix-helix domain-containing protein [Halomarina oriensis]
MSTHPSQADRQRTQSTERWTVRMDTDLAEEVEALVEDEAFPNRSEVVRQAVRELVEDGDE